MVFEKQSSSAIKQDSDKFQYDFDGFDRRFIFNDGTFVPKMNQFIMEYYFKIVISEKLYSGV